MNLALSQLLKNKRDIIVRKWATEIKNTIAGYAPRPIEELWGTTRTHLDGIIEILRKDSYKKLIAFMHEIAPLRINQKFRLSEIQRAFLIGKNVILQVVRSEYDEDTEKYRRACSDIEEPFKRTIFEYSDIYQELQIREAERHSSELLKAEEERQFLQQLREAREKLDRVVAAIGADIAILDRQRRVVWHNRYLAGGEDGKELRLGKTCDILSWHQEGGCYDCATARAFASGQVEQISIEKPDKNNRIRYYQIIATPLRSRSGAIEQVIELVREVTNIRELERRIGTQQEFLQAIRNDSADAIIGLDAEKMIIFWNKGAETIFGYTAEEILNTPFSTLAPNELIESGQLEQIFSQVVNVDFIRNYETKLFSRSGVEIPVDLTLSAIHDEKGSIIGLSAVIRDVSERRRLEEKVLQTERLATVGRMAAKVAHDIRNPLSSISLNAELLGDELASFGSVKTQEARNLLESITSEVDRLAQISEEYLQFSRSPKLKLRAVDINSIIIELTKLLSKELLSKKIRLTKRLSKHLPLIKIDRAQIHRALLNLMRNAVESMPKGGNLKLVTDSNGKYLEVHLIDTGEGIEESELPKIFEPFHSTKEFGTGLGLTITQQIIEEHSGTIRCTSQVGIGTEFIVQLPIREVKRGDLL